MATAWQANDVGRANRQVNDVVDAMLDQPSYAKRVRWWLAARVASYPCHRRWLGRLMLRAGFWLCCRGRVLWGFDEVRRALSDDVTLPVAWGWKMERVTAARGQEGGGRNFVLGMPRCPHYDASYEQLATAFPLEDEAAIAVHAAKEASAIVEYAARSEKPPQLDAVEELITAVPAHLCRSYYGLVIPDERAFARQTLVVSSYLFGPDFDDHKTDARERYDTQLAAEALQAVIRQSIMQARSNLNGASDVLRRLIAFNGQGGTLADDDIHAQLFGMVLGFIPTNVLAGGNILETLLGQPEFLRRTRQAALSGDDESLWRHLRETLRFRNINPGPLRRVRQDGFALRRRWRTLSLEQSTPILASTQAAMFDARRIRHPDQFDPARPDEDYLVFGVGQHWCLGAHIAKAQLTQTFKPLLMRDGLRAAPGRKGKMTRFSWYPLHLHVEFSA